MSQSHNRQIKIANDRLNADQGDFFFVRARLSDGQVYPRPVFVIGRLSDSNDDDDVIVCSCTKGSVRTDYDIPVQLKMPTSVRTNKIYTIRKDQMQFKIEHNVPAETIEEIIFNASRAIELK
ncbi:type II toxin-antitoxin system PemK/MazF family toxin [Peribacillus frigoritolerans]|uniref:type II toxin-antitoxin system PemK/MazF family toxin n=1 Tax=Peribacillus frigoritolerans TaxID=450367 RepID=UPI003395B6C0